MRYYSIPHLSDTKTEDQENGGTCPASHDQKGEEPELNPGSLAPEATLLTVTFCALTCTSDTGGDSNSKVKACSLTNTVPEHLQKRRAYWRYMQCVRWRAEESS